ncbi:MAG: hypothetical protein CVT79_00690 [Alphaproteobacteria bacterium HGW-Alphaproteobacteria-18]|nr:MAG: hypothetical protein CVT79_00690 [Alphaproteobacteria bacterium HGW-Alphaproteobacteria-18]
MPVIRPLMLAVFIFGAHAATADANGASDMKACKAMAATLAPKQADITEMTTTRDAAAATLETTGDAWEDAETHRLVSASHAATADTAKAAYDDARQVLARRELALQASVRQYNDDVAAFNSRCARK